MLSRREADDARARTAHHIATSDKTALLQREGDDRLDQVERPHSVLGGAVDEQAAARHDRLAGRQPGEHLDHAVMDAPGADLAQAERLVGCMATQTRAVSPS